MTKQELIDNMREMVKYILPEECREDKDIVENYTDTMVMIAEEYHTEQLKLYNVSKAFNSEEELLQFIYMHTPIAIKPKSKRAKRQLVSTFKSGNAFEQVCKHLAKKLFNAC